MAILTSVSECDGKIFAVRTALSGSFDALVSVPLLASVVAAAVKILSDASFKQR